jgi:hypothetical protein
MPDDLNRCALEPASVHITWCRGDFRYITRGFVESKPAFSGFRI